MVTGVQFLQLFWHHVDLWQSSQAHGSRFKSKQKQKSMDISHGANPENSRLTKTYNIISTNIHILGYIEELFPIMC